MSYYNENCRDEDLKKANPLDFYTPDRLDIGVRIIMLERLSKNALTKYYRKLYGKLILLRNGGYEPNEYFSIADTKNGVDDYIASAYEAFKGIQEEGFLKQYFIPVNEYQEILDGSHRIASAILLGQEIWYQEFKCGKAAPFSSAWFTGHGFHDLEMLTILKTYGRYKEGCKLLISPHESLPVLKRAGARLVGKVRLRLQAQGIVMLKKQLEGSGIGYRDFDADYAGDVYLSFIEQKKDSVFQNLEKKKIFCADYSNYVNETLNLNSLLYYKKFQADWGVIAGFREAAKRIDRCNIKEEFYIAGQIIPAMFHMSVKKSLYLIMKKEHDGEEAKRLAGLLSEIGKVTQLFVEDTGSFRWEENYFTCYGLRFLSVSFITRHESIFDGCSDGEECCKICGHMNDFLNRRRWECIERSHYKEQDALDVSDWSV